MDNIPTTHGILKQLGLSGSIAIVGDLHEPWADPRCKDWIYEQVRQRQPKYIVQDGDAYDYYCFSKFARSYNLMTPNREIALGRTKMVEFWKSIRQAAPKAECIQLLGNHDTRAIKRVLDQLPEAEGLIDWDARHAFDGVTTRMDEKDELRLGKVFIHHGHKRHGQHARWNQTCTAVGHLHTGGIIYYQNRLGIYWELNVGYVGDPSQKPFAYRYQKQIHGWTRGLGTVDEDGPKFVLYPGRS